MKFAAILYGILASMITLSAHASLQAPGSFAPTVCGSQSQTTAMYFIDIDQVCVGQVVTHARAKVEAIEFRLTSGQTQLFVVSGVEDLGASSEAPDLVRSVATLQSESGDEMQVKMLRDQNGKLAYITGQLNVITFKVDKFQDVYVIQ